MAHEPVRDLALLSLQAVKAHPVISGLPQRHLDGQGGLSSAWSAAQDHIVSRGQEQPGIQSGQAGGQVDLALLLSVVEVQEHFAEPKDPLPPVLCQSFRGLLDMVRDLREGLGRCGSRADLPDPAELCPVPDEVHVPGQLRRARHHVHALEQVLVVSGAGELSHLYRIRGLAFGEQAGDRQPGHPARAVEVGLAGGAEQLPGQLRLLQHGADAPGLGAQPVGADGVGLIAHHSATSSRCVAGVRILSQVIPW